MVLGSSFRGDNVSTSFKVRHVDMTDVNSFPVAEDLTVLAAAEVGGGKGLLGIDKKNTEEVKDNKEVWEKHATVFGMDAKLGIKETIAFSYNRDVHVEVNYEEGDTLPVGPGSRSSSTTSWGLRNSRRKWWIRN